jgi:hypothetical protein
MHLDNINKESRKLKFPHNKSNKKKFTYYAYSKKGYIKRDYCS